MDAPTLESSIRINDGVLFQELHGEGVLLNLKSGTYFGLDPVGRRVWQLLQDHRTLSAVLECMLAEFDVDAAQCSSDLVALAADLAAHGLVTIGQP
jgi:hypothetical protein